MQTNYRIEGGRLQEVEHDGDPQIVVVINPETSERAALIQQFQIDEHTFHSALDPDEVARIEYEDNYTAIIFKKPKSYTAEDHFQFKVSSCGVFIYENLVLVLSDTEIPFHDDRRFNKMGTLKAFVLRLLNFSIYHFTEHLRIINRISDDIEQKIESSMKNEYLIAMFSLSKSLTYYLHSMNSNDTLLRRLQTSRTLAFSEMERDLLEDLMIENQQCLRQTEIYSNILSSMTGARASIVSNNLNILMKTLNILTVGIMMPTFVVSAFSMNVPIPLEEWDWAFPSIMGLATFSVGAFVWFYKSRNW